MQVASIATDVRVHTWPDGQLLHTYKPNPEGSVQSLSWSKDGAWLILVPNRGHAEIISVKKDIKHLLSLQEIQRPSCAAFQNSTKRNIAVGSTTGAVLLYDVKSKLIKKNFPKAPSTVFKIEFCAKDTFFVAACENGEILLYNTLSNTLSGSYKVPSSKTVSNIRCHQSKTYTVGGCSQEGIVAIWDIYVSKLKYTTHAHSACITDLTFSPLCSDMFVTTGLDRKFMFFETKSKNCVIYKVLEKSPTSIDFSPDGKRIAVALQSGIVHAYDIRQMDEPVHTFTAHTSQINQILFQKTSLSESGSFSFSEDKIKQQTETSQSSPSYNSLIFVCSSDLSTDTESITKEKVNETADSFLKAIGGDFNFSTSVKADNCVSTTDAPEKLCDLEATPCNSQLSQKEHSHLDVIKKSLKDEIITAKNTFNNIKTESCSSTPKFFSEIPALTISPIVGSNYTDTCSTLKLNQTDVQMIRNVVKEEIKQEMETMKEYVKYEVMDAVSYIRQHFLDLQMSLVKEFINVEQQFNYIKQNINSVDQDISEDVLMQENVRLSQEVRKLRSQLLNQNKNT